MASGQPSPDLCRPFCSVSSCEGDRENNVRFPRQLIYRPALLGPPGEFPALLNVFLRALLIRRSPAFVLLSFFLGLGLQMEWRLVGQPSVWPAMHITS